MEVASKRMLTEEGAWSDLQCTIPFGDVPLFFFSLFFLSFFFFLLCILFCLRLEVFRNHFMAPFFIHCCVGQHSLLDGLLCHVVPSLYLQAFSIKRLPSHQVFCQYTVEAVKIHADFSVPNFKLAASAPFFHACEQTA